MEFNSVFERCHNFIYANEGLLKDKVFNEVLKIIFIKMVDEKKEPNNQQFYVTEKELKILTEGKSPSFNERILKLFENVKAEYPDIFPEQHEKINLKPLTLAFIVNQLQRYSFSETSADVIGSAFQSFVYVHQRGSRGEFFTPTPIIELAVSILNPRDNEKIIDPACGSGGFLIETMKWINKKAKQEDEISKYLNNYWSRNICGIDIVPDLVRVSKMRMMFYGDGHKGIFNANSLLPFDQLVFLAEKQRVPQNLISKRESFDILMTNPPFGTKGKITDKTILKIFDLGHKWTKKRGDWVKTKKLLTGVAPEKLFIERCLHLLKDGGRMAIVLPDGILENPSQGYIRKLMKSNAKILAVINLPAGTFIPYGSGINASILFLQKLSSEKLEREISADYDIFFGIVEKIGYETTKNGKATYKRNERGEIIRDSIGNPIIDEDLTDLVKAYNVFRKSKTLLESDKAFLRKVSEIEDRWDPQFYRPIFKRLRERLLKGGAVRLGDLVNIVSKKAAILKNPENLIRYVELSDVDYISSELVSLTSMRVYEAPTRAKYEIKEGDVITAISGNSTGTEKHVSAYVTKEFNNCICTNGFRVLRPKNIDPRYLLYFLKTKEFLMQIYQFRTGAAIPAVSDSDLRKVLILVPERRIQEEISQKMKEIYELRKKSIDMLSELKEMMEKIISGSS